MLQRIQSVFLLGIVICMILFNFFPLWAENGSDGSLLLFKSFGATKGEQAIEGLYFIPGILAMLVGVIAMVEIFRYNNRLTQIKLGALNALLMASLVISSAYLITELEVIDEAQRGRYGIGLGFVMLSLVCNLLANRFIRRDEKLVKSVDRIR